MSVNVTNGLGLYFVTGKKRRVVVQLEKKESPSTTTLNL